MSGGLTILKQVRPDWQRRIMFLAIASLAFCLLVGLVVPMERLDGKGWPARAAGYPLSSVVMGAIWLVRGQKGRFPYIPTALLVTPFILDLLGNLFRFFDTVQNFDDFLHFVNWMFLGAAFVAMFDPANLASWNRAALGTGFGAFAIILWEFLEYLIMQSGTTGLHLSYEDTVTDLLLSSSGGLVGSLAMVRLFPKRV